MFRNIVTSFICLSESKCIIKLINFVDVYDTVIFKMYFFFHDESMLLPILFIDIEQR